MMHKSPTLKDVAKLAGVSVAAVSAVLNSRTGSNIGVSEATKQRIVDAVQKLGYVANPAARSLAGQRNQIISIFTYEAVFPFEYHDSYYPFMVGIEHEAEKEGYDLLLMASTGGQNQPRAIYRNGINRLRLADGAILLGNIRDKAEVLQLARENFPFVFIGHREPGAEISYVAANYTEVTAELVTYMVQQGHRQIVLFRIEDEVEPTIDRELGYRLAHKVLEVPLPSDHIVQTHPEALTRELIEHYLQAGVTAFIGENYALAEKVMILVRALKHDVPQDISIAVLGDLDSYKSHEDWTTFQIPCEEMGKQALRMLVKLLQGTAVPPIHATVECTMILGATVGKGPYKT
jgi:DNA-binding LacI/PurR family transcriptional regulator